MEVPACRLAILLTRFVQIGTEYSVRVDVYLNISGASGKQNGITKVGKFLD